MKKIMQIVLLIILSYSFYSCNTTEPPVENMQPGRRDYIWTLIH